MVVPLFSYSNDRVRRGRSFSLSPTYPHAPLSFVRQSFIMNGMRYGSLLGWGICVYAVMMLAWSGLALYGFAGTLIARVVELLVLVIVLTIAGRSLRFHSWKDILPYSILWVVIMALLDAVYSVPLTGWGMYVDWNLWVGYALVAVVPLLAPQTRIAHEVHEA